MKSCTTSKGAPVSTYHAGIAGSLLGLEEDGLGVRARGALLVFSARELE